MTPKLKNIILFGGLAASLIAAYFYYFRTTPEDQTSLTVTPLSPEGAPAPAPTDAADFLPVLLNVKSIRLDDAIFADPAFATLHDSSILLVPDGTEGRPNPFAPIGSDRVTPPAPPVVSAPPSGNTVNVQPTNTTNTIPVINTITPPVKKN